MTQVDFYILGDSSRRSIEYLCCQLTEKAITQGKTVYIQASSSEQALRLDELLWKYKPESFLAHKNLTQIETLDDETLGTDFHYPIVIGAGEEIVAGYDQVLINLDQQVPMFFSRFNRVAEMVGHLAEEKSSARERYRFYKSRGYPLNKYDIQ